MRNNYLDTATENIDVDADDAGRYAKAQYRVKPSTEKRPVHAVETEGKSSAKAMVGTLARLRLSTRSSISSEDTVSSSSSARSNYFGVGKGDLWEQDAGQIV